MVQQTWQHPKSKHWHCIDYVIMRKKDVAAMCGTSCKIDHRMVRMKLVVGKKKAFTKEQA